MMGESPFLYCEIPIHVMLSGYHPYNIYALYHNGVAKGLIVTAM